MMRFWTALAAAVAAAPAALADSTVVPAANSTVDGNAAFSGLLPQTGDQITYQMVLGTTPLAGIPAGSQIVGITLRANADGMGGYPSSPGVTISQFDIQLATSLNPPGSLSTTFADNAGVDGVTVRSGALALATNSWPGGNSNPTPNGWGLRMPFTTPFTYLGGNLLVTFRVSGGGAPARRDVDAVSPGAGLQAQFANTSGAATATTTGNPLVTRLDFIPPVAVSRAFAPFDLAGFSGPSNYFPLFDSFDQTIQFIVGATELTSLPRGSRITGFTARNDEQFATWPPFPATCTSYSVEISRSNFPVGSMSGTITDNQGPDLTTVRTGPLAFAAGAFPKDAMAPGHCSFGAEVPFTTPYTYNGGDLHFVIRHTAFGAANSIVDGVDPGGIAVQWGFTNGTTAAMFTGTNSACAILRFTVEPFPFTSSADVARPGDDGLSIFSNAPLTWQSIISSQELSGLHPGAVIDGLSWRLQPDGQGNWPPDEAQFSQYDVQVSTSPNPPGSMSTTFASNIGADVVVVRSGPLVIPINAFPGGAAAPSVNPEGMFLPFKTHFVYAGGDISITVRQSGSSQPLRSWDSAGVGHPGYGRRFAGLSAPGSAATTGAAGKCPLTRFHATPGVGMPLANARIHGTSTSSDPMSSTDHTVQYLFDASQVVDIPSGSPITGLSFRKSTPSAAGPSGDLVFPDYTVQISTSPNTPGTMSDTFAANIGADVTTTRAGPLTIPALELNGAQTGTVSNPHWFYVPFSRAYIYNGGPLCVTIRYTGSGTGSYAADSNTTNDAMEAARGATTSNATMGTATYNPVIMRLAFTTKRCPADYDGNGFVNGEDFDAFNYEFYFGTPFADFDGNGFTNGEDFDAYNIFFYFGC